MFHYINCEITVRTMSNLKNLKPFKKGEDTRRNTKGRPKGTSDIRERFQEIVNNQKVRLNGKEIPLEQFLMMRIINEARSGKLWAIKLFMDYTYGKPKSICPRCEQRHSEEYEERENYERRVKEAEEDIRKNEDKWFKKS